MRYYDTATGNQAIAETATTIIDSDVRVESFFNPLPEGYRRAVDGSGLPFNELIPPISDEDNIANVIVEAVTIATAYIQDIVDDYNTSNGVAFGSVHNMAIYTFDATYTHYQFALDIIAFNKLTWETARASQDAFIASIPPNPTAEDFLAILPSQTTIRTAHGI